MPTSFSSYDLDRDGTISSAEWAQYYPEDAGPAGPTQPSSGGEMIDFQKMLDFYAQMQGAFGPGSGFEFTPQMLESFGMALPAMGMYSEFQKAEYQQDALDFMREELGVKGREIDLARQQLEFEAGPVWDWYKNEFFPMSMENQRLEFETQRAMMGDQRAMSAEDVLQEQQRTLQSREGTAQAKESTRQSQIASQIARYNALEQIGMGETTRTADGRRVRGSGYTYGYT